MERGGAVWREEGVYLAEVGACVVEGAWAGEREGGKERRSTRKVEWGVKGGEVGKESDYSAAGWGNEMKNDALG